MKKNLFSFYILCLFSLLNVSAQETFKVMFYNLLNYPLEDAVPNREQDLEFILSDYQPDLFLVCELNNVAGANTILNITKSAISTNFEMATYVSNTSDDNTGDQNDLQNLLYYDSTKFILEEQTIVPTDLRDFNIYKIKLNTINQDSNPIEVYVVVCHLKASSGETNAQRRFNMVQELDAYLSTLPATANVILGGDLNLYTAAESAFQELLDVSNHITFADPANRIGSWHNNSNFVDVFTQSTRTQTGLGGTTGGFDDRFDFLLMSQNMINSSNLTYVDASYQVYGNNGLTSCYNSAINSSNCAVPSSQFSFEIREALHNFSDHLPVTLSLETDATFLSVSEVRSTTLLRLEQTLVKNTLSIIIETNDFHFKELMVYNSLGQHVKTFQTNSNQNQKFNVSELQTGLHYLVAPALNLNPIKFIISN
jgi:exonuclease III